MINLISFRLIIFKVSGRHHSKGSFVRLKIMSKVSSWEKEIQSYVARHPLHVVRFLCASPTPVYLFCGELAGTYMYVILMYLATTN